MKTLERNQNPLNPSSFQPGFVGEEIEEEKPRGGLEGTLLFYHAPQHGVEGIPQAIAQEVEGQYGEG